MTEEIDWERVPQKYCAELLSVTTRTLRDWEAFSRTGPQGIGPFPRNRDGTYNMRGMMCWVMLYRQHPHGRR